MIHHDNRIKSSKHLVKQRIRELEKRTAYLYSKVNQNINFNAIFAMIKLNHERIANLYKK